MPKRFLLTALILLSLPILLSARSLTLRGGIGYDYLSQGFFLDSLADDGIDTIPFFYRTRSTYLNEVKGIAGIRFRAPESKFTGDLTYEQTQDQLRLRIAQEAVLENGSDKLSVGTDLEWRKVPKPDSLDESYLFGNLAFNGKTRLSRSLSLRGSARAEGVRFTGELASSYDYYRVQGKFGPSFTIGSAWLLDTRLTGATRQAPDSSVLSYQTYGSELTVAYFGTGSSLDLFARGERKIVSSDALSGDLTRVITAASGRIPIAGRLFGALESDWEWNDFSADDPVNNDFGSIQGALLGGIEWGALTLSIGPELDLLWEVSNIEADEDYAEWGGRVESELSSGTSLLVSASFSAGHRDHRFEDDFRSDFAYGRFDLFGIWGLASGLQLTALFSIDSEWGNRKENNSSTALVSSSLVCEF